MYIQKQFPYSVINIEKFCKDEELEACALKLDFLSIKACIITVYRSPNGNVQHFIKGLDNIIKKNCKTDVQLIICGDINIWGKQWQTTPKNLPRMQHTRAIPVD